MELKIISWESKGLRCPDGKVDLCENGFKRFNFIQMPNGTGKTTYLELIQYSLSGFLQHMEGVDIGITIYEDAHHGFDRRGPIKIEENGYSTTDCHFQMRSDGALLMNIFGIPMITPIRQKLALAWCAERGTTIGGNDKARKASFRFAREFMLDHLFD